MQNNTSTESLKAAPEVLLVRNGPVTVPETPDSTDTTQSSKRSKTMLEEWIAGATFATLVLGLLGRGVWLISRIHTVVNAVIIPKITETHEAVTLHAQNCDPHRQELDFRLTALEKLNPET